MIFDVYHHIVADGTTRAQLNEVLTLLRGLNQKAESIMSEFDDVNALLQDIKVATDDQAIRLGTVGTALTAQTGRLDALIDALKQGGSMTPEQMAALAATAAEIKGSIAAASSSLDDEVEVLRQTGVDPDNPTP